MYCIEKFSNFQLIIVRLITSQTFIHFFLYYNSWRHSDKSSRPSFSELMSKLANKELLKVPTLDDGKHHPQAHMLGACIGAGNTLHLDLQNTYNWRKFTCYNLSVFCVLCSTLCIHKITLSMRKCSVLYKIYIIFWINNVIKWQLYLCTFLLHAIVIHW